MDFLQPDVIRCPFVRQTTGGYGDMEIESYYCGLYNKEFPNPDWDSKYMSGCKNECSKRISEILQVEKSYMTSLQQFYKNIRRIVDEIKIIERVIND